MSEQEIEMTNDKVGLIANHPQTLYILGKGDTEIIFPTQDAPFPFERVSRAATDE